MESLRDKLWLVKIPEVVYSQMLQERDLGTIECFEATSGNGEKLHELKINLPGKMDLRHFKLSYTPTENFFTFKEKKSKPSKISQVNFLGRFMALDEKDSDLVTLKVTKAENTNRPSVRIDQGKGRPQSEGIIPISVHQYAANAESMEKAIMQKNRKDRNLKKTRMDRDDLKSEIFSLFNEQDYWTNKELAAKLDQPDNYLKEVLSEICDYIKSGPKKGYYELKRQYLRSQKDENDMSDEN